LAEVDRCGVDQTESEMPGIGIGVVGVGVAALSAHIPAVVEGDEFRLLAICDRDPGKLEAAQKRWQVPYASTDLKEFLRTPALKAVVVATPPDSHFEIACAAISEGKHVLVEKPLAVNLSECKAMMKLAALNKVLLLVGHEKRFHPTFQKVRSLIREGLIGKPYYGGVHWASAVKLDPVRLVPDGFLPGYEWRWRNRSVGGGILQDHLPHYVDLVRDWIDDAPIAVYAQTMNVAREFLGWPIDDSVWEDLCLVVVRFANGFVLRFETGTVGRSISPIWSLGSGIGEWTEYGYVFGTHGQLVFDLLPWDSSENGRIAIWRLQEATGEGRGWSYVELPEPSRRRGSPAGASHVMFGSQIREFASAIAGKPTRGATGEDGTISVAAVESAYQSAALRKECYISEEFRPSAEILPNGGGDSRTS
jgi:UDP-N-acetyl-2-amino-2-deoxyglucuronate dehydrogenase